MFPSLRQRVVLASAAVVSGLIFLQAAYAGEPAAGWNGCTLLFAASPIGSIAAFTLAGLAAMVLGSVAASTGNVLAGPFVASVGLAFAAVAGGPIDDWQRYAGVPDAYWLLALEAGLWMLLPAAALWLVPQIRLRVRPRLPRWWWGPDGRPTPETLARWELWVGPVPAVKPVSDVVEQLSDWTSLTHGRIRIVLGSLTTLVTGWLGCMILLRVSDTWQVMWGVGLAFLLAALLGHQLFPSRHPVGYLMAPLVLAAASYLWVAAVYPGPEAVLGASYPITGLLGGDVLPRPAMALPIVYASAGVAGATVGVGWSQVLIGARRAE